MSRQLIGTWELISFELHTTGGDELSPLGDSPIGIVIIDKSGYMSAQLSRGDRAPFSSDPPPPEEIQTAFTGFIAYFGKYRIDEKKQTFTTRVQGSSNPDWIGEDQIRYYEIQDNRLILKTMPMKIKGLGNIEVVGTVIWKRIEPL
ncbi:MAG: lipocalin-like domain-containing protein [Deltaproteobacteria bacterium]|nr:lipocalin-like domain-containing protein [Deltaproteobacteria bacterium]